MLIISPVNMSLNICHVKNTSLIVETQYLRTQYFSLFITQYFLTFAKFLIICILQYFKVLTKPPYFYFLNNKQLKIELSS